MILDSFFPNVRSLDFVISSGSPIKDTFHGRLESDGSITLVQDGVIDIQEQINSFEPSTNLYNIISRLGESDYSKFADLAGSFVDATEFPTTYAEALQLVIDGQRSFERLPVDVKQKFDNDFNKWFSTAGSPEWFSKLGIDLSVQNVVSGNNIVKSSGDVSTDPVPDINVKE